MFIIGGITLALLLIVAFLGWGRFAVKLILGRYVGDWPYQAACGICVLALFGGIFNLFGWVSIPTNVVVIVMGAALFAAGIDRAQLVSKLSQIRGLPTSVQLALAAFVLAACATIVISLFPMIWDTQDDSLAYAVFPTKMLQTGTFIESFSHRRIIGYGAHPCLQSLVVAFASHHELPLLDQGIATVLAASSITYYSRRRLATSWVIALCAGTLFMVIPPLRINLSPVSIFSLLSLTLLETAQLARRESGFSLVRCAFILALVSAALMAMRANAIAVVGSLLVFIVFFDEKHPGDSRGYQEKAILLTLVGVITVLFLLPWALTLVRSSGTPFYPLIGGFYNRAITMSSRPDPATYLTALWQSISYSGLPFLLISTILGVAVRALPRALACYTGATLVVALAMFALLNLWGAEVLDRYYSPFTRVAQILILSGWCTYAINVRKKLTDGASASVPAAVSPPVSRLRVGGWPYLATAGAAALAIATVAAVKFDWKRQRDWSNVGLTRSLEGRVAGAYKAALPKAKVYDAALAAIPKGARILAQVDAPFLLNFREHEILITDDLGVVSPPPGLPSSGEPNVLVDYLESLSIDYLMFVNPKGPMREGSALGYHLDWWNGIEARNINNQLRAPYFFWFLNAIGQLSTRYEKLYDSDEAVVLALKSPLPENRQ